MNTDALNRIRGSLLKHSLWLLLANTTLGLLLVPVTISSLPAYIYVGAFLPFYLVLFLSMWLLGRGSREAAAWTLVGGIFILQGFANVFNPGAAEQAMASFINLILLAGVTLNRRAGLVTAGMALSGMVVYLVMFDLGMLPEPFISLTLLERIPIIGLTVLTTGGLVAIAVTHVAWAFNGEQQARRQAQASSESLSLALAENHLRARLSNDLVGMSQRLLTSHETMDQLGTLADTLIAVDGLHAVALFRADGVQLVERGWQDARRSDAAEIAVTLDGLHNAHTMRLRGVPELLHSEAAGDFYRAAAGLLSTAEARLEAEQRLQRANQLQAVGRLAAGIAHDFNNLLVSIQGGLELAQLQLQRGRSAVSQLSAVELAAERAVRLTRSMTSLTDSREQPRSPTPLAPVLRELVDSMVDGLPDRVTLKLEAPVPDVCLAADRVELEQIIFNLVSNANEAMLDAGTIDLGISIPDEEPRMLRLDVRDTGAGMGPDVLARMFEPFYTTRAEVGGHGLGLTSVQSLVDRLGGRISAASEVGVGSCLSVWLPLSPGDGGARPSGGGADVAEASEAKQGALEGLSVLVVDDEAEVRDVVTALLESLGARVDGVGSGPEALESLAGSQPYALLVTDVRMPGMDGHALLRAARAAGHGLPAILSSGFDPADPEDADELRPFRRLAKPFRRDQLLRCIQGLQELAPAG